MPRVFVNRLVKKYLRISAGTLLMVVGIPLMVPGVPGPGLPFFLIGLAMLAREWEPARRLYTWLERKFPRVFRFGDELKDRTLGILRQSGNTWQVFAGLWALVRNPPTGEPAPAAKSPAPAPLPAGMPAPGPSASTGAAAGVPAAATIGAASQTKPAQPVESGSAAATKAAGAGPAPGPAAP